MTASIVDDILVFLNEYATIKGYCAVGLNMLEAKGISCAVFPAEQEITKKEYINGSKLKSFSFNLLAQCLEKDSAEVSDMLMDYADMLDNLTSETIGTRLLVNATATYPRLSARSTNLQVMYSVSVSLMYKE